VVTITVASQSVVNALVGHLFPFAFLLAAGLVGLAVATRWNGLSRRSLFYATSSALGVAGAPGLGLAVWPSIVGTPAVIVAPEGIACAPWRDAVAWKDVTAIELASQKMGYGWITTGAWLQLKAPVVPIALPREPSVFATAEWIWRADPVATLHPPFPEPRRYCNLLDLDRPALARAVQDAWDRSRGY